MCVVGVGGERENPLALASGLGLHKAVDRGRVAFPVLVTKHKLLGFFGRCFVVHFVGAFRAAHRPFFCTAGTAHRPFFRYGCAAWELSLRNFPRFSCSSAPSPPLPPLPPPLRPWADAACCLLTPLLFRSRSPFAVTCHHCHHRHRCHRPRRLPSASSSSFTVAATLPDADSLPPNQHQRPETTNDSPLAPNHHLPRSHRSHHRHRPVPSRGGSRTLAPALLSPSPLSPDSAMTSCTRTVRIVWSLRVGD